MKYPLEKNTLFLIIIVILLIGLISVFFFQKKSSLEPADQSLLLEEGQAQIAVSSDEEAWDEITLPKIAPGKPAAATESKALKLLNAHAASTNLKNREGKKMTGLRILGEIQNMGNKIIENAIILVNFYGEDEALIDTKTGVWHQDYKFLTLPPGGVNVYEVLIPEPPTSETISLTIKPNPATQANNSVGLEIKGEKLEGAVLEKDGQQVHYFKFTGILVNNHDFAVLNPGIYIWIKDDKDKVIGASYRTFNDKKLEKKEEFDVQVDLLPISSESKVAYHTRGRGFAEKL